MHYGRPELRFDKSWTGEVGESTVKKVFEDLFGLTILPKPEGLTETGYDYGDVHFSKSKSDGRLVANVTSRKLSKYDSVVNIFINPDQYYVLIPNDQLRQYTTRSNFCFPVFIKYTEYEEFTLSSDLEVSVPTRGISIIPGFLTNEDIKSLVKKNVAFIRSKGQVLRGLYDDLSYSVPMYTNNYVIPTNLLRNLETFEQFI